MAGRDRPHVRGRIKRIKDDTIDLYKYKKKKSKKPYIALAIAGVGAATFLTVFFGFKTRAVNYYGTDKLTVGELENHIFGENIPNSLVYRLFNKKNNTIPFVESYSARLAAPGVLDIYLKEKELAGYTISDGYFVYIDPNGEVCDMADILFSGIPRIELPFDIKPVTGELLIPDNPKLSETVAEYANAFRKNGIKSDAIKFDDDENATLQIGEVTVLCGGESYIQEKMERLANLSAGLEGLKGILHLEKFDGTQKNLHFSIANAESEDEIDEDEE